MDPAQQTGAHVTHLIGALGGVGRLLVHALRAGDQSGEGAVLHVFYAGTGVLVGTFCRNRCVESGADKPVRAPGGPGPPAGRLGTSEQYV